MAKSKNHTNHNQSFKDHRNGIKKAKRHRKIPLRGVDQKFMKNLRYSKKRQREIKYEETKQKYIDSISKKNVAK
ncbi:hypothetical protein GJ496_007282 [Pomphorhynchus laevis]|nr:hypothetical protein GJ496_007282 [Pomphorhynchus laevis]